MCRTEKQILIFSPNKEKNRKALRQLEAKQLYFLPSFLINPSQEYLISFVLQCHTLIIQRGKWNSLLQKLLAFAPPPKNLKVAVPPPLSIDQDLQISQAGPNCKNVTLPDQTCTPRDTLSTTQAHPDRQDLQDLRSHLAASQPTSHQSIGAAGN